MLVLAALCFPARLHAQPPLDVAEQALAEHLPEVAIEKLHAFLASPEATDDALRERAEADLTRALLDSGDDETALARLEYPANDRERFWKAEALLAQGRWEDALPIYQKLAADGPAELRLGAGIGEAEAQHALGEADPQHADVHNKLAIAILAALDRHGKSNLVRLRLAELYIEAQKPDGAKQLLARVKPGNLVEARWRQFVEGRMYLAEDQPAPALQDFDELLADPRGLTPALHAGATVGKTKARVELNGLEVADDVIEYFIGHYPESPYLEEMFRQLDAIYAQEENPSDLELQGWVAAGPPRRAALGLYYEARSLQRQGHQDKAIRTYTQFVQRYPRHQFAFESWMQLGQLYLETERIAEAIASFEGAMRASTNDRDRARAEIASGNTNFAQGEYLVAQEHFHNAAQRSADYWLMATYDSALAWLHLRRYDRFLEDYTPLSERYPETEERRTLLLEEGRLQAYTHDPHAEETLETFVRDFPDDARVGDARLALAEMDFADGDTASAGSLLQAAYVTEGSDQTHQQADYLAVFLADTAPARDDANVIRLGLQFLKDWPGSTLLPQIRMKLGQVYFRREDFANAQTQFETLAQESPTDQLADKALILAGQSAVRGMSEGGIEHALELFQRVATGTGPLKLYARQEQALVKAQQGLNDDAVKFYEDILRSNPDVALRIAALCGKADCLVAASGTAAPLAANTTALSGSDTISTAISLYDQIIADPDATPPWRDEALYKKAGCLARQGAPDEALAAYYDILNAPAAGAVRQLPDYFWFEKAGYDAEALLEAKSQWPGAISLLEKIAQAGGPRSADARKRAEELRLQHFIWE
jgi:TolA-binding protein